MAVGPESLGGFGEFFGPWQPQSAQTPNPVRPSFPCLDKVRFCHSAVLPLALP